MNIKELFFQNLVTKVIKHYYNIDYIEFYVGKKKKVESGSVFLKGRIRILFLHNRIDFLELL